MIFFFFQAEDGIRDLTVTGVQTCALPISQLVEETVERFGGLDVLVANAGGPPAGRALEVDDAAMDAAIGANLLTSVRLAPAAVPHLRVPDWGRICFITFYSVKQPIPPLPLS